MNRHQMRANYQQSGHTILYCEECGYRVQIENATLEKVVLNDGDKMNFQHVFFIEGDGGIAFQTATKPENRD